MNYKTLFTTLALCVCLAAPVMAAMDLYESKIVPVPTDAPMTYGILSGSVRCGYSPLTKEIGIKNDIDPAAEYQYFPILSDGTLGDIDGSHDIKLIPGNYTLELTGEAGNGGQTEQTHATVVAGKISYPVDELLGHAVSQADEKIIVPEPTQTPGPICHEHRIWIIGHYEPRQECDKRHHCHTEWDWVPGHWYTWTCCKHHCNG